MSRNTLIISSRESFSQALEWLLNLQIPHVLSGINMLNNVGYAIRPLRLKNH